MPYRRRRSKRTTSLDFLDELVLDYGPDEGEDMDEVAAMWNYGREDLLANFVERHPGRRPWAWWRFEAEDPPPYEQIPEPEHARDDTDDWEAAHHDWLEELELHRDAEWEREQEQLRFLAEGGHLEPREVEVLLAGEEQSGDRICHRTGPALTSYQWADGGLSDALRPGLALASAATRGGDRAAREGPSGRRTGARTSACRRR